MLRMTVTVAKLAEVFGRVGSGVISCSSIVFGKHPPLVLYMNFPTNMGSSIDLDLFVRVKLISKLHSKCDGTYGVLFLCSGKYPGKFEKEQIFQSRC